MRRVLSLILVMGSVMLMSSCTEHDEWKPDVISFRVTFPNGLPCGENSDSPCSFSLESTSFEATVRVEALDGSGQKTDWSGYVVLSPEPSGMYLGSSDPNYSDIRTFPDGRLIKAVKLENGQWEGPVRFVGGFGETSIFVEDVGYTPSDDVLNAACINIYPAPGCYAKDDDDPEPGSGAVGISPSIFFENPSVYDIQKPKNESQVALGQRGADYSPLDGFRVNVYADPFNNDVQKNGDSFTCPAGKSLLVVTQVSVAGFFVTDVCDSHYPDYTSAYIFNFNTPEELSIGDCLLSFQGGISEFQGFTEIKNPFWTVDECKEEDGFCEVEHPKCSALIPDPVLISEQDISDPVKMEKLESAVVQLNDVRIMDTVQTCDMDGDGAIDYAVDAEKHCKYDCADDPTCIVYEDYEVYHTWTVHIGNTEVGVVTRGVIDFDPTEHLGCRIPRLAGNLKHLDFGRPAWILLPRNIDDFDPSTVECN